MPRVSKRKKKETAQAAQQAKYYRTVVYVRLSRKDGGHGRKDSIYIQKQICTDFIKKHPEMLLTKIYIDNGVTGTTFNREEFERLMDDVRAGKIDCIVVKDFSRFGRDALDAVDLIDVIFPSLDVRFISVLDDYDSENPACTQDRVSNILKHFMNDYYAREVSVKLVQAHKQSRERGEFWGARPPYGYKWSPESKKILIPDEKEKKTVQQIFDWYVFHDMSSYDIAKELNTLGTWTAQESHEIREYGKRKNEKKLLWQNAYICQILQNPVYIGAAVYGKTRRMLADNMPLYLVPRSEWDIQENVREPLIERTLFEESIAIAKKRWKDCLEVWGVKENRPHSGNGPLLGKIYCERCEKKLRRRMCVDGKCQYAAYYCPATRYADHVCSLAYINEKYIFAAIEAALKYQIKLAVDNQKKYGAEFYQRLEDESKNSIRKAKEKYESYNAKIKQLFEHYATGLLDKEEYMAIKESYTAEQEKAHEELVQIQNRSQTILDTLRAKMDWAEELLKYQNFTTITKGIVDRFIERVLVKSCEEITVCFWFGDIFQKEILNLEGGLAHAV